MRVVQRRECAVEKEASRGIATSRDWGCAIDVGEAAAVGGGQWDRLPKAFSVGRAVFLVDSIF